MLSGFKENVITGHLIPAGTGTEHLRSIRLKYLGQEIEPELPEQAEPEHSIDEVHSKWRDGAAEDEGTDDMLPDEAREFGIDEDDFDDFDDYADENGEEGGEDVGEAGGDEDGEEEQ